MARQSLSPSLARLLLRIAGGGFLLPHGLGKLFGWFSGPGLAGFAAELEAMQLPHAAPLPLIFALLQTGIGLAVLLGWASRPAAVLGAIFLGVTLVPNAAGGWFWMNHGVEYPLFWLLTLCSIALLGPGRWSLDHWREPGGGVSSG